MDQPSNQFLISMLEAMGVSMRENRLQFNLARQKLWVIRLFGSGDFSYLVLDRVAFEWDPFQELEDLLISRGFIQKICIWLQYDTHTTINYFHFLSFPSLGIWQSCLSERGQCDSVCSIIRWTWMTTFKSEKRMFTPSQHGQLFFNPVLICQSNCNLSGVLCFPSSFFFLPAQMSTGKETDFWIAFLQKGSEIKLRLDAALGQQNAHSYVTQYDTTNRKIVSRVSLKEVE